MSKVRNFILDYRYLKQDKESKNRGQLEYHRWSTDHLRSPSPPSKIDFYLFLKYKINILGKIPAPRYPYFIVQRISAKCRIYGQSQNFGNSNLGPNKKNGKIMST